MSIPSIGFPPAGLAELEAGAVSHPGVNVAIDVASPATAWSLSVRSDEVSLGAGGKPLRDLEWRLVGSANWTAMSGTDVTVAIGTGDATIAVEWRTRLAWSADPPGDFAANVTFTLSGAF